MFKGSSRCLEVKVTYLGASLGVGGEGESFINGQGHMTKMAAMAINSKNP